MYAPDEQTMARVAKELLDEVGTELLERLEVTDQVAWNVGSRIVASFTVGAKTRAKIKRIGLTREPWGGSVGILVYMHGGAFNEDMVELERVRPRLLELIDGERFDG